MNKKQFWGWSMAIIMLILVLAAQLRSLDVHAEPRANPLANIKQVEGRWVHSCALTTSGGVKCWGHNKHGALGDGTTTNRFLPTDVNGLTSGVTSISAGALRTCALTGSGGVKCWGDNYYGELGDGTTTDRFLPTDVNGLTSGVASISAGGLHTCVLTKAGGVKCWGDNYSGELGDGTTTAHYVPTDVSGLTSGVASISTGLYGHTCAVISGGGVKCWGQNTSGDIGDGTRTIRLIPTAVSGLTSGATSVSAGTFHTCAVTSAGGVKCWGENGNGELGDGTTTMRLVPTDVSGLTSGATFVAAGESHTCTLTSAGGVKCWGNNADGELGDGTTTMRLVPTDVLGLTSGVVSVSVGRHYSCAFTKAGGVKCWGNNADGELGDGTTTNSLVPVDVTDPSGPTPTATPVQPTPSPTVQWIESGFDPKVNALNILNVSAEVTWKNILDTFGESYDGDASLYIWYSWVYQDGTGGLCFGMVLGTALMNMSQPIAKPVPATDVYHIPDPGTFKLNNKKFINPGKIHDFLVKYFIYQESPDFTWAQISPPPNPIKDSIIPSIDGKLKAPVAILFKYVFNDKECAGHIVLPYAYAKNGTEYLVKVYDPNKPGVQDAIMKISQDGKVWSYDNWSNKTTCPGNPDLKTDYSAVPLSGLKVDHVSTPWFDQVTSLVGINLVASGNDLEEVVPYNLSVDGSTQSKHTYVYSNTAPLSLTVIYTTTESAKVGAFSVKGFQGMTAYGLAAGSQDKVIFDPVRLSTTLDTSASGVHSIQTMISGTPYSGTQLNCLIPIGSHVEFIQSAQTTTIKSGGELNGCTFEKQTGLTTKLTYNLPNLQAHDTFTLSTLGDTQGMGVNIDHESDGSQDESMQLQPVILNYIYLPMIIH